MRRPSGASSSRSRSTTSRRSRREAAFHTYFGLTPPAEIATLTALTPGDFAVVRRKAALLGRLEEPEALAAMLSAECAAKPDRPRPVGFRA